MRLIWCSLRRTLYTPLIAIENLSASGTSSMSSLVLLLRDLLKFDDI